MINKYGIKIPTSKKYFIISVILLPVLFQYATPIHGLTIGDVFLLASWLLMVGQCNKVRIKISVIPLLLYVIIITIITWCSGLLIKPTTSIRYIAYLFITMCVPSIFEYKDYAYKIINSVGIAIMIVLYLQYIVLMTTGIIIPGLLTFLPLTDNSLQNYTEGFYIAGRCMSVFAEPSHYAIYILLFIAYRLFLKEGLSINLMILPVLASLSLIFASSFTGLIGMVAVWGLKLFYEFKRGNISFYFLLYFALAIVGILCITIMTSAGAYLTNSEIYDSQSMQRFEGYYFLLENEDMSNNMWLFGNGMNDIGDIEYLPGWPRLIYYFGVVGSLLYILSFLSCVKKNTFSFVLLILMTGLMIGTEMNFGPFFLPYIMLLIISTQNLYIGNSCYERR